MQFMILLYSDEKGWAKMTPAESEQAAAAYTAYSEALQKSGVLVGGNRLKGAASATTVRKVNGKTQVLDGPYADTKEQLGGYFMIEVPNLDTAIDWAARCPGSTHGVVEIRPLWTM
jgi:hypothetical protein